MADKMIRCPDGHFYDRAKHPSCPWCDLQEGGADKTRPARLPGPPPPPGARAYATPPDATRRVNLESSKSDPVVGWLVCVEGPDRGRDFRLHAEKNFIGRSPAMDVAILNDDTVSRERHSLITFDPKKQVFWVSPGDASGLVYLNGELLNSATTMKSDDILEIGHTKLVFIPFCGERYSWHSASATTEPESPDAYEADA